VTQVGVLGDMEPDCDGGRVALADFEVDVAHRRVKRTGVGVGNVVVRRNGTGRWKCDGAASARALVAREAGEHDHDAHALLETWRIRRKQEDGTGSTVADEADARPDVDGAHERVAAGGDEDDAFALCAGGLVDGGL
jgi:hypothetical protein